MLICKPLDFESSLCVCFRSFYRFVLESDVTFLANDTVSPGPVAHFMELPESPLLTLNMITPESWIVQAVRSPHDLDNIHLQEVSCSLVITTWQSYHSHPLSRVEILSINNSPIDLSSLIYVFSPGEQGCDSRVWTGAPFAGGPLFWPVNWPASPWTAVYPRHETWPAHVWHYCHG